MIIAVLLLVASNWKELKCHSTVKCLSNVYPFGGILLGNKKKRTLDSCDNLDGSQKYYVEFKGPKSKVTYYMIPFI